jgi:hypothetical protein
MRHFAEPRTHVPFIEPAGFLSISAADPHAVADEKHVARVRLTRGRKHVLECHIQGGMR